MLKVKNSRLLHTHPSSVSSGVMNRFVKGVTANILGQGVYTLMRIILPPLFIYAWGVKTYGEWLVLSSIVTYLTLSNFGSQLYIVNRLTQLFATQNITEFCEVLHTGILMFLILPLTIFILFVIGTFFIPSWGFLHITETSRWMVNLVLIALAFQFVFSLPQGLLLGVYRAIEMLPFGVMLSNAIMLFQLAFTVCALWLKANMLIVAIVQTFPFVFVACFAAYDLNRRYPEFKILLLNRVKLSMIRGFIRPSLNFFGIQLSMAFSIQGMVVVVGLVLGSLQVVIFSTMRTIVSIMRQLLGLIASTAWPELTSFDARKEETKIYVLFRFVLRTTLVASGCGIILLHYIAGTLFRTWLHGKVPFHQNLMDLFLIYMGMLVFWTSASNLLMAINKHYVLSKVYVLSAIVSIIAAYFSGLYFGLYGVVLSMVLVDLFFPFWVVPYLMYRYNPAFNFKFFAIELLTIMIAIVGGYFSIWACLIIFPVLFFWWLVSIPRKKEV